MTPSRLLDSKYAYRALTLIFLLMVTLTMSAQWTAQEEGGVPPTTPGYRPRGLNFLPSSPRTSSGVRTRSILIRRTPMSWHRRFQACFTSSLVIAIATAWATTACTAASKTRTERGARPA